MKKYIALSLVTVIALLSASYYCICYENIYAPYVYTFQYHDQNRYFDLVGDKYDGDSVPDFDTPIVVYSNGEYTEATCKYQTYSKVWNGRVWDVTNELLDVKELDFSTVSCPKIKYSEDFALYTRKDVEYKYYSIYKEDGQQVNTSLAYFDTFPKGSYYIVIRTVERGDYVLLGTDFEERRYVCIYEIVK